MFSRFLEIHESRIFCESISPGNLVFFSRSFFSFYHSTIVFEWDILFKDYEFTK